MGSILFIAATPVAHVYSQDASWANCTAGTGTLILSSQASTNISSTVTNTPNYIIHQHFHEYDVHALAKNGNTTAVTMNYSVTGVYGGDTTLDMEFYLYDWGASVTTSDFVPSASIGSLTRIGYVDNVAAGSNSVTIENLSAFKAEIEDALLDGRGVRILQLPADQRTGTTPTSHRAFSGARLDLTVTYDEPPIFFR